jgi:hypothetical protein
MQGVVNHVKDLELRKLIQDDFNRTLIDCGLFRKPVASEAMPAAVMIEQQPPDGAVISFQGAK